MVGGNAFELFDWQARYLDICLCCVYDAYGSICCCCEGRVPAAAPTKLVLGTSVALQYGGDAAPASQYGGVLPDIYQRAHAAGQSAPHANNFGLSIISAPAPIANRQTDHAHQHHHHHYRHTDDPEVRRVTAATRRPTFDPTQI